MRVEQQGSPVPGISRNVFLLAVVSLLNDISSEMLYPLIPLFLTGTLGAPVAVVGVIEGFAEMTASLLKGISGWFSDRWGRRLPFVISGYGLSAVSKTVLAIAHVWPTVLAARVSDRFGKGLRDTARDAIIAESSTADVRGRSFGFHRSMDQIGAVTGPLIALPLLGYFGGNYRSLFLFAFIPGAIATLLLFLVRETGRRATGVAAPHRFKWSETTPAFRRFLLVTVLFAIGNSSDVFLILRAKQVGLTDHSILFLFALFNAVTVVSAYPAGTLSDRTGRRPILIASLILFALVYAGFAIAGSTLAIWWLFAAYGFQTGINEGLARAFAVDLMSPEHQATALGLHGLATGVTTFIASSTGGFLWSHFGSQATFWYGAVMAAMATLVLFTVKAPGNVYNR